MENKSSNPASFRSTQKVVPQISSMANASGKKMPATVQSKMEAAFGSDFSNVKIHESPQVAKLGAVAYTQGENIFFAPGKFQPNSQNGQALLGHELAHVVQQRAGKVKLGENQAMETK